MKKNDCYVGINDIWLFDKSKILFIFLSCLFCMYGLSGNIIVICGNFKSLKFFNSDFNMNYLNSIISGKLSYKKFLQVNMLSNYTNLLEHFFFFSNLLEHF